MASKIGKKIVMGLLGLIGLAPAFAQNKQPLVVFGKAVAARTADGGSVFSAPVGVDNNGDSVLQDSERTGHRLQISVGGNSVMFESFDEHDSTARIKAIRLFSGNPTDDYFETKKRYTQKSIREQFDMMAQPDEKTRKLIASSFIVNYMNFVPNFSDKKNGVEKFIPGLTPVR